MTLRDWKDFLIMSTLIAIVLIIAIVLLSGGAP